MSRDKEAEQLEVLKYDVIVDQHVEGHPILNWPDITKQILALLTQAKAEARIDEVRKFTEKAQSLADDFPPNLLLNELVSYKFDRLDELKGETTDD